MDMKKYFLIGAIFAIIVNFLLLSSLAAVGVLEIPLFNNGLREKSLFIVVDECGPVLGSVIHNIANDEVCKNKCIATCSVNNLELASINFLQNTQGGCNTCECFCN